MRDWKSLYEAYRDLHARYSAMHRDKQVGLQVLRYALESFHSRAQVEREVAQFGLLNQLRGDWPSIAPLRRASHAIGYTGYSRRFPAESVYQTAIQIRKRQLEDELDRHGERRWFYRGQRNVRWPTYPTLLRGLRPTRTGERRLVERVDLARRAVAALRQCDLGSTDFEALAIAQHYADTLNTSTWLLDVTTSPYVALFFASDHGTRRHVGVVDYIERTEWLGFSGDGENTLGAIRYVTPHGIPRITNQAAFFLELPHAELYRQLSMRRYYFRQQPGVVFEDPTLDPPVTRSLMYPVDDPVVQRLPTDWKHTLGKPLALEPGPAAMRLPEASTFVTIAKRWMTDFSTTQRRVAEAFCRFHAILTSHRERLPFHFATLHQLRSAVQMVGISDPPDIELILNALYLGEFSNRPNSEAEELLIKCIEQVEV